MKNIHTSSSTSNSVRLLQLLVFLICLLIAARSEAQNQLIDLSPSDCQHRFGDEQNLILIAAIKTQYNYYSGIDLESFSVELVGNFDSNDLNNSTGGALFYTKRLSGYPPNESIRQIALGEQTVTGPGVYTFTNPLEFSINGNTTTYGIYYVFLELSPDADESAVWARSEIVGTDFLFDPPTSLSGTIPFASGTMEPAPVAADISFQGGNGFIVAEVGPSENEGYRFEVTNGPATIINSGTDQAYLFGLQPLTEYPVKTIARRNLPGCTLEREIDFRTVKTCFQRPQSPDVVITDLNLTNFRPEITNMDDQLEIDGVGYRTFRVMREAGSPEFVPQDGDYPVSAYADLHHRPYGSTSLGNGNFYVNTQNGRISGLTAGTTYELDTYIFGFDESNDNGSFLGLEDCILFSAPTRTTFTTCSGAPQTQASGLSVSNIQENSVTLSWTNGSGEGRLVLLAENAQVGAFNGVISMIGEDFDANNNFSDAEIVEYGTGAYPSAVYKGIGSSVTVTGLETGTNYGFYVLDYQGDGLCRSYISSLAQNFTTLSNDLSVSTQNATNRTPSSAIAGGNITLINNVTVTERGLVWSTGSNPDLSDNSVTAGTGSGAFTAEITGLNPERRYHVRAYAVAGSQTFYGNNRQFFTVSNEPSGDPTNFELTNLQATSGSNLSASFDWDGGSGASGYLLLYRRDGTAPTIAGIEDGIHPEDLDLPSGTFIAGDEVIQGTGFTQNNGVLANQEYHYLLISVAADQDNNPLTYNYKTEGSLPTLNFTTDVESPTIVDFQPSTNESNVPTTSILTAQFNEPVVASTGVIQLIDRNSTDIIQSISVDSEDVSVNGHIVNIDPGTLPFSTEMYVTISEAAFEDSNGNQLADFNGKDVWQFTTAAQGDTAPPVLVKLTPENNSNQVSVSTEFEMKFNEPVTLGSGTITIKRGNDDTDLQVIPVDDTRVSAFKSDVTITPSALPESTDLYFVVDDGAITDLSGNAFEGFNNAGTWSFSTATAPDLTAPSITSTSPSDDQTVVALNSSLVINFDEPVRVGEGFVAVRLSSNNTAREIINVESSAVALSGSMTRATIQLANDLPADTELYVEVSTGAFEDEAGNNFAGILDPTTWSFTTAPLADGSQPQLLANALSPAPGTSNVPFDSNLSFAFNENVFKGTGDLLITNDFTGEVALTIDISSAQVSITDNVITVNPTANLVEGNYVVTIPATAFKDSEDNFFEGILDESWVFSTAQVAPALTNLSPADNSSNVALDATLTLTFDEEVEPGSGLLSVRRMDNGATLASFQPEDSDIQYNGTSVSLDLDLPNTQYGTEVFVQVGNGFFQDLNGNAYTGFTSNSSWNFTLESQQDVTGPEVVMASLSPSDNGSNTPADVDLMWSFDENVLPSAGQILVKDYSSEAVIESYSAANAIIDQANVILPRTSNLPEGRFFIEIEEGAFQDDSDNLSQALTNKDAWDFFTVGTPPSVDQLVPAPGSVNVGQVITAVATFDEPIAAGTGNILVRNFNSNATIATIPIGDAAVDISENVLSIDIDLGSFFDIPVYIQVVTGAITDLLGNNLTELNNNTWNYTLVAAPDVNAPVLFGGLTTALSPQRGSGTTPPDELLEMTFNEEVQAGTGSILLYRYSDDQFLQGVAANSPAVTISGNQVTIDPPQLFDDVQTYILVSNDAFQDNSGNFFGGISDKDDWYFFPEISRPELVSMNPENGSTNLPVGEAISFGLTFSEDIQIDDTGLIRALRKDNNGIAATTFLNDASVQVVGNQLLFDMTFSENEAFSELEMYLSVNGTYITDLNGNNTSSFGSFATTGFTTEAVDLTAPFIIQGSYVPENFTNNASYNTNLSFEMSEPVFKGFGNINIRDLEDDAIIRSIDVNSPEVSISGTTVTINPAEDLPEAQLYIEVEEETFQDSFGNPFAGLLTEWKNTWRIYMFEEVLEVVDLSPAHGSTNIQVNEPLTFEATFSHPIEINTDNPGDILIRFNQGNGIRYTIPATDPSVSADGNVLRFDLTLDPGPLLDTELYIQLGYGVVRDVNGISKNLNFSKGNWHFTTEEATPPIITLLSPTDDATGVAVDENFTITFNEDVSKLNFYATLHEYDNYNVVEVFDNDHTGVTISGNEVTINPDTDLTEGVFYYVSLSGNSVTDFEGAGNTGISGRDSWNFGVGDTEAPAVVSLSPADNASEVALDATFTITFDEPVFEGGIDFIILRRSTGALVEYTTVNDARVSGLGTSSLVVDFNSTLQTAENYYITVGNSILEDAFGNKFGGWSDVATWSFSTSTADIIDPLLSSLSPPDDESDVPTNTSFALTFNEDIQWGSGDVVLKEFSTNNTVETFNSGSGNFTLSSNQLILNPSSELEEVTAYYIEVATDAIEDFSGNPYDGFTGNSAWNVTTLNSDLTAPTVDSFSPADDVITVSKDLTQFSITFSEAIVGVGGFLHLRSALGGGPLQSFDVTDPAEVMISNNVLTLNDVSLAPKFNYYIQNAATIQDLAGNTAATWSDADTWSFGTFADVEAPTVVSFSPPAGTTGLSGDESFTMTFNEEIVASSSYAFTIKEKPGNSTIESFSHLDEPLKVVFNGTQVTLNPDTELDPFTEYYITVSGLVDDYNNSFAGFSDGDTWNFVVGELDNDPPTIASTTPANGSTDIPLEVGTFSMTFSEPIFPREGDLYIRLRSVAGNSIRQEFGLTSDDVVIDGNTLTLLNVNTLSAGHEYWLQGGTILEDEAGNLLSGWANNASTWSFTTEELPTHTAFSPADGAVDVSPSSDLVLTFNKPVQKGSGSIKLYDYIEQTEITSLDVASSNVTVDNDEVTITLPGGMPDFNLRVYVLVDEGAFLDNNGNSYNGISSRFTWDFELLSTDQEAPVITFLSPADNSVDVDTRSNLVIEFDEEVFINNNTPFRVKRYNVNNTQQQILYPSDNITLDGNTITIEPILELPFTNQLWIEIPANSIKDEVGNAFSGITIGNRDDWDFTMIDALVYQAFSPATFSVDVNPTTPLQITFPRNVVKGSGSIRVFEGTSINELMEIDVASEEVQIVGNVVTVTPVDGLPDQNIQIHIQIEEGAFEDEFGNPSPAVTNTSEWRLTLQSTDVSAPEILSLSPADDGTDIAVNSNLVMTFNEPVFLPSTGTRIMRIHRTGGVTEEQFDLPSARVTGYGTNVITIDPTENFLPTTGYYVTYFDAFEDEAGNLRPESSDATSWNFTTETLDVNPPQVVSVTPADNSTEVAADQNLVITFDEEVVLGNSSFLIKFYDSDVNHKVINYASDEVVASGNTITINPETDLMYGTQFWVQINAGSITDTQGNEFAGILDKDTWNFTTAEAPDAVAPTIVSVSPATGSTDVAVDSDFVITFDEPVQKGNGSLVFSFYSSNGGTQFVDVSSNDVTIAGNTVTIDPPLNLLTDMRLWLRIPTSAFEDLSGNNFAGINIDNKDDWEFTTSDTAPNPPVVSSLVPAVDATAVALDSELSVTFSENVMLGVNGNTKQLIIQRAAGGSGNFQVAAVTSDMIAGDKLTIPHDDFEEGITYRIIMAEGVIADMDNNSFSGFSGSDWTFTTIVTDTEAPQVVSLSPADNANEVSRTNWSFDITFDEAIQKGSGTAELRVYDTDGITANAPVSTHVSISGNTATIDFNTNGNLDNTTLNASTRFYIEIPDGLFEDLSGNAYTGHTKDDWDFTTAAEADVTAPSVVSLSPADNATDVSRTNWSFDITFDEAIQKGSGTARLRVYDTDGITANALVGTHVSIAGNTATIDFNTNGNLDNTTLNASTRFYIEIPDGLFEDLSGNTYTGHTKDDWDFTTAEEVDVTAPTIVSVSPTSGSTDVPVDSDFVITFDEAVRKGSGSLIVSFYSSNGGTQFIDVNSNDVTIDGNTVTIDPPLNLLIGIRFWMRIPASAFEDLSGNNFAGISIDNKDDWEFTTSDTAPNPPVIASLQPADGATGVALDAELSIAFSEDIMFGVNGATKQAVIRRVGGGSGNFQVIALSTDMISGNTLTIPHNELEKGITYSVLMNTDVIADLDNNSFTGLAVNDWTFTTLDNQDQTITFDPIEDKVFGDSFELDATVSSGLPVSYSVVSGPISLNGATVTVNGVGVATIAANQAGDAEFNPAPEVTQTFNILKADQIITIEAIDDKLATDAPFDIAASVDSDLPLTYEVDGPASILGTTVTLSGTTGTVTVTVSQAGNENYNAAVSTVTFRVSDPAKIDQTITFEALADKTFGDAAFNLTASASSGLDATFSVVSGPITVSGAEVTITGVGTAVIAANQPGDDDFNPAPEVTQSFEIAKADQVIAIQPIDNKLVTDTPFNVVASVNSGLELSLEVSGPATIVGTTITLDGSVGTVTVTASQDGNDNYNAASESVSFDVTEVPLSIDQDLASVNVYPNPTTDYVTIEGVDELVIQLFNLEGRKLIETTERKIDLRHLASGSYILLINNEKRIRIIKAN